MKPKLTIAARNDETPVEQWATDRPYTRPNLTKPDFPDHSKQPERVSQVRRRIDEINAANKIENILKEIKPGTIRAWLLKIVK